MNQTKQRSRRIKDLTKGAVRKVGPLEMLGLRAAGLLDGCRDLPRRDESGRWTSAFIDREVNGYEEFCSRMWSMLQLESEASYIRLTELTDSIPLTMARIDQTREELAAVSRETLHDTAQRKRGEEALTEDQVASRREREKLRRQEPLKSRLRALETGLQSDAAELATLCSRLTEDNNTVRMAIHRVQDHTLQRLDIYWNGVLKRHAGSCAMPMVPEVTLSTRAERAYLQLHKDRIEQADWIQIQLAEHAGEREAS